MLIFRIVHSCVNEIRKLRCFVANFNIGDLRVFCANFGSEKMGLCYFLHFLHVCKNEQTLISICLLRFGKVKCGLEKGR